MAQRQEEKSSSFSWWDVALAGAVAAVTAGAICYQMEQDEKARKIRSPDRRTKEEYVAVEHDGHERRATVHLYTYPPKALPGAKDVHHHHWAIVVKFEDLSYRTLDGYGDDDDGQLYGHYSKEQPRECHHKVRLGELFTSPLKLRGHVMNNMLNGTPYNMTTNNCQDWALVTARELGDHIHKALAKVDRVSPGVATLLGMYSAATSKMSMSSKPNT